MIHFLRALIVLALTAFILLPITAVSDESSEQAATETGSYEDLAGGYAGDEACLTCHEGAHPGFDQTVHSRVMGEGGTRSEEWPRTCETCHGPGAAHVAAGGGQGVGDLLDFQASSPEAIERENATCLGCHRMGQQLHWEGSSHDTRDLACTTCHNPVEKVSSRALLAHENPVETCASCHLKQRAQTFRNQHMPLREGWMSCTSCHNPHGSPTEHMLVRSSTTETCYTCHADKRGPFLWEHAPVNEDCGNCHDPHGTPRQAMLKISQPRLCQTCHLATLHPGEARLPGNKFVIGSSCLNCHTQIHGSNHPSGFALTR